MSHTSYYVGSVRQEVHGVNRKFILPSVCLYRKDCKPPIPYTRQNINEDYFHIV